MPPWKRATARRARSSPCSGKLLGLRPDVTSQPTPLRVAEINHHGRGAEPVSPGKDRPQDPEVLPAKLEPHSSSGGRSKFTRSPRKPCVFQAPKAMPTIIQMPPTIHAFQLRFFHRKKQIVNPARGGAHTARIANAAPAATSKCQFEPGHSTNTITSAVTSSGGTALCFPSRT